MSIVEFSVSTAGEDEIRVAYDSGSGDRPYHRLGAVRRLQGISRRTIARRLQIDVSLVRRQENEFCDLPLSVLYLWQQALDVPMNELFSESDDTLSKPLQRRAQLVRLMKTAMALAEQADADEIRKLAQGIVEVLLSVMPELHGITAWHVIGKRRRLDELGAAAMHTISEEVFVDFED